MVQKASRTKDKLLFWQGNRSSLLVLSGIFLSWQKLIWQKIDMYVTSSAHWLWEKLELPLAMINSYIFSKLRDNILGYIYSNDIFFPVANGNSFEHV